MNKKIKCDIYTRVSTTMQVDGYGLDAFAFSFTKGVLDNPVYERRKIICCTMVSMKESFQK